MTQTEVSPLLDRTHAPRVADGALAGCAQTTQGDRPDLPDHPIDCATVDIDVAAIPGAGERAPSAARLVVPLARIVGRVTGQLDDGGEIASGRTEEQSRARIAGIEAAGPCAGAAHTDAVS